MKKFRLLIDGDIFMYEALHKTQERVEWEDDYVTVHCDTRAAKGIITAAIESLIERFGTTKDECIIAISHADNWRKKVLPSYKANRIGAVKPVGIPTIKRWFPEAFRTEVFDNLEADDILGIRATEDYHRPSLIVSADKDLRQIPGYIFNPQKSTGVEMVSEEEADRWHRIQTLVGDQVDNYPGCPTIGAKRAEPHAESWEKVLKCFEKHGQGLDDMLVNARVARILRTGEYDFETKEVKLWTM